MSDDRVDDSVPIRDGAPAAGDAPARAREYTDSHGEGSGGHNGGHDLVEHCRDPHGQVHNTTAARSGLNLPDTGEPDVKRPVR